jgi:undecaprenyl-diphosphatase
VSHLTYLEAMVVGLVQGITELFPISSLGHNVLIPALIGGSWARDLDVSAPESPYLAFIVGMHVATALAMIAYFWRDWLRIIRGLVSSVTSFGIRTAEQRLAWMIILATIPVGVAGLALEHLFRVAFSRPVPTALFLAVNGILLIGGERVRRRRARPVHAAAATAGSRPAPTAGPMASGPALAGAAALPAVQGEAGLSPGEPPGSSGPQGRVRDPGLAGEQVRADGRQRPGEQEQGIAADRRVAAMPLARAVLIGSAQILALLPGISRDGAVMVSGMLSGLSRADAARYSFLLSAPVILAAGALKVPDLMGPLGNGIRGQVLAGSLLSGIGAFVAVRFLVRYFSQARSLTPFGIYCLLTGLSSAIYLTVR